MTTISIRGLDELQRKLGKVEDMRNVLRPPMQRATFRIQRVMATYPPKRPGSKYIRTDILSGGWTTDIKNTAGGVRGIVGNNVKYAPWVQSSRFQAGVHRGRWHTDEQTVREQLPDIVRDFERAVQDALDGR